MIINEIISSLIRNSKKQAIAITLKYGLAETIKTVTGSSAKNYYYYLVKDIDKKFQEFYDFQHCEFEKRSKYLESISKKLIDSNINHCFFKGSAYSLNYYQQPHLRPYNDFDILIDDSDLKSFYSFLDNENLKHRSNYKFLHRFGYTRTALEVINSDIDIPFDFHHRFVTKFFKKDCPLKNYALQHKSVMNKIYVPAIELLISSTMYHCFTHSGFALKIINIIDIAQLLSTSYDREALFWLLKKTGNLNNFKKTERLINNLSQDIYDVRDKKIINDSINFEKKSGNIVFSKNMLLTQISHLIDPEPYINYAGGDLSRNKYFELLKIKGERRSLRNSYE